jgi:hypothetical protein
MADATFAGARFVANKALAASFARVKLTMSVRRRSGSRMRYMPAYLASGTMLNGSGFDLRAMGVVSVTDAVTLGGWVAAMLVTLTRAPRCVLLALAGILRCADTRQAAPQ